MGTQVRTARGNDHDSGVAPVQDRVHADMTYSFQFRDVFAAWDFLLDGLRLTLELSLVTMVVGLAIGVAGAAGTRLRRAATAQRRRRLCRGDPQHAAAGAALSCLLRPAEPRAASSTPTDRGADRAVHQSRRLCHRDRARRPAGDPAKRRSRPAIRSASPAFRSSATSSCSRR